MRTLAALALALPRLAAADNLPEATPIAAQLEPQLQADVGLSVIAIGGELPVTEHVAVMLGAGIFGTYFLPWFDLGDNMTGAVADLRITWFRHRDGRGLYVAPYGRIGYASGSDEDTGADGSGLVATGGAFVGYALGLSPRIDLRLGVGAQYMYLDGSNDVGASTVFPAIDITLGLRSARR